MFLCLEKQLFMNSNNKETTEEMKKETKQNLTTIFYLEDGRIIE